MKKNLKYYVDTFIQKNQFIEDGLYNQYINITSLALMLQPYFSKKLGENISFDSVKMALFRAGKNITTPKHKNLFSSQEIYIKKWINVTSIKSTEQSYTEKLFTIKKESGNYLSKIYGDIEVAVVYDDFYKEKVEETFWEDEQVSTSSDLIIVWVRVKDWTQATPGVLYSISKKLLFHWINIIQVIQTNGEFAVVVNESDMQDTVYAISSL